MNRRENEKLLGCNPGAKKDREGDECSVGIVPQQVNFPQDFVLTQNPSPETVLDTSKDNFTSVLSPSVGEVSHQLLHEWQQGQAAALLGCGGQNVATVYCRECGFPRQVSLDCGSRLCPTCREKNARRVIARWKAVIAQKDVEKLALVTLTRRVQAGRQLKDILKETQKAFSRLIRTRRWRGAVLGGVRAIEAKWSVPRGAWNLHLHVLVEARARRLYRNHKGRQKAELLGPAGCVSMQWLSEKWRMLTGDSYIVDISPCLAAYGGAAGGLRYVLKYLAKGPEGLSVETPEEVLEYQACFKGRRVLQAFGHWHGVKLPAASPFPCPACGSIAGWLSEYEFASLMNRPGDVQVDEVIEVEKKFDPGEKFWQSSLDL